MSKQVGPECELLIAEDRVYTRVRGGVNEELKDVINAAHNELQWLQNDWVAVDTTEIITVDSTSRD